MVFFDERERSWETHYRGEAGALRRKALSWFAACVLALTAGATGSSAQGPDHLHASVGALGHPPGYSQRGRGKTEIYFDSVH